MGFTEIEAAGKKALERYPIIKRSIKRVYQVASVSTNNDKLTAEGNIIRVSPNDEFEYFYGYYDKSPWDATDRYMICLRVRQAYKSVAPKEPGTICIIDTENNNKIIEIGSTHAWNVQQGCMAQWLGPDFNRHIIYNDYRNGHYCSVVFNIEEMKEEKVLSLPVYDVSRDGKYALSLDFNRLHRLRPGYGYSNQKDKTKGVLCPNKTCIWKIDIQSGKIEKLFKYTDFESFETDESMIGAEHKVNHLMISPNGKRFMVLHRWFDNGRKHSRLITVNVDKTDMYNLSDDVFVSHCYWKNDGEILSFLRKKETGDHYYLMKDKTQEYRLLWPELNTDGHCSYSPDGQYIITDTYPNRKRIASVSLCSEDNDKSKKIARVFSPFKYDNDCRCDLHPRWNRAGDKICIDSVHEGKRGLYVVNIPSESPVSTQEKIPRIIHKVWFGDGKYSKVAEKCMTSWETFLPGYDIKTWNEMNFDVSSAPQYVKDAYQNKKWAFVSDYVRLKDIYDEGGIYFDTDMEIYQNIDDFLKNDGFFCTESHYTVSTAVIAAKPHAPWIKDLLDEYDNISFVKENGTYLPNTKRVQRYLESKYDYHWSNKLQVYQDGLVIFPSEYFSPLNCFTGVMRKTEKTVGMHHYDNTWKTRKDKLKKRVLQIGTRIIGEENRAKLVVIKSKL